ncbi:sensor histidine kinase [Amycolatopsis samaneae]
MHVLVGFPLGLAGFVVSIGLAALSVGLAVTAVLGIFAGLGWLSCVQGLAAVQRARFAGLLGVRIGVPAGVPGPWGWRRLVTALRSAVVWRQFCYHVLAFPLGVLGFGVVTATWSAGFTLTTIFAHAWWLPEVNVYGWDLRSPASLLVFTLIGLALLYVAPWPARALAALDATLAGALLGPSRSDALASRLRHVLSSRAQVVDAADVERRRIERDLHDGAQQRLTSLAMKLGIARSTLTDLPVPATELLAEVHDEAKQALAELRDFVRGLHPAVLNDRGLDAALSGIAARMPIPVRLRVEIAERPSPTVEAVAYFVVSEALTNVAKHAEASSARVEVNREGDRLRLVIEDDGRGGADPGAGSGLRGLTRRVESVDGMLRMDSPRGGPTRLSVELPCES